MNKRVVWALLRGLSKPKGHLTLRQELARGLQAFNLSLGPPRGTYALEIGTQLIEGSKLDRLPSPLELEQTWKIAAGDYTAHLEVTLLEAEAINEKLGIAQKHWMKQRREKRILALLTITANSIPALKTSEEENVSEANPRVANIFTNCEVSQLLQSIPALPNEDAFVAEMGQALDKYVCDGQVAIHVGHTDDTTKLLEGGSQTAVPHFPSLEQQIRAIEQVAHSRGQRVNKLFHDPVNEQAIAESDYTCIGPNENIPCYFNTLFFVQAKPREMEDQAKREGANVGEDCDDSWLREGVARVVARIMDRKDSMSTLARFALGVVYDGKHIVFVRIDLKEEETTVFPVYVSKVLLPVAEGLRYLARMMCCASTEQFGLPSRNLFELLFYQQEEKQSQKQDKLPSLFQYVRALGSGGFADVAVVVRDCTEQRELVCKLVRDGADSRMLAHEAFILGKLQTITAGVPRVVHYQSGEEEEEEEAAKDAGNEAKQANSGNEDKDSKEAQKNKRQGWLLTSPVGLPLFEHMKSLRGEGERHSFAQRVFEELKAVLSAVHAKGIVHGDIKPDNIVVTANGEHVFLIDWGCAMEQEEEAEATELQRRNNQQKAKPAWWKRRVQTPFMSMALLFGQMPTPRDDERALLLTYVAIRESPIARAPWPHMSLSSFELVATRSHWLREYARNNTEIDLSLLL